MTTARPAVVSVQMQIGAGGAWVDVSADLEAAQAGISYEYGKDNRFGEVAPSRIEFELVNNHAASDGGPGKYTPDNPLGPHYGRLMEGVGLRWTIGDYDGPSNSTIRYRHWFGEVQAIVPIFPDDNAAFARVQISGVDILAKLARTQLQDYLTELTLADDAATATQGARALWLMGEGDGALVASESSPFVVPAMPVKGEVANVKFGGGNGLPFDGLPTVQLFDDETTIPGWFDVELRGTEAVGGRVLEMWFSAPDGARPVSPFDPQRVLAYFTTADGAMVYQVWITLRSTGRLVLQTTDAQATDAIQGPIVDDGRLHHLMVYRNATKVITMAVDGVVYPSQTTINSSFTSINRVMIGYASLSAYHGFDTTGWLGTVSRVAIYTEGAASGRAARHYAAGRVMADTAATRAKNLVGFLRGQTVTLLEENGAALGSGATLSAAMVGPQETQGGSLLDALKEAWAGEGGRMWTTSTQYTAGAATPLAAPRITLGGRATGRPLIPKLILDAEADLAGAPSLSRDTEGQVAVVTGSSRSGQAVVQDEPLVTAIGPVSTDVPSALLETSELQFMAEDRLARGRTVRTRITGLTADAMTATIRTAPAGPGWSLHGPMLGLLPGDRIRVTGLPVAKLGFSERDCYLVGGKEEHGIEESTYTLDLEAADDPAEFWLGDSVYGRLSGDGLQLNAGITASALSLQVKFTGTGMSTDSDDYPLDLDVNGERVTVASAPGGSSSPQTLTLSARGVGDTTARAHLVNETVDVWLTPALAW